MRGRRPHHSPFGPGYAGRAVRRRSRRPRGALRALALVCVGSALGGAIYGSTVLAEWAVESEAFRLKKIEVSGAGDLSQYEIVEASGVERGVNIFRVPVAEVERSVSSLPTVKCCFVERRLPDRLFIRVAPRKPYFLFNRGRVWRADREGVVLGRAAAEDLGCMLMAGWGRSGSGQDRAAGETEPAPGVALDPDAVNRIVSAIRAINRYAPDLRGVVSEICVTQEGELVLFTSDPPHRVHFGADGPKAEGLVALSTVLRDLSRRGLAEMEIDMRFERQLVVRRCEPRTAMRDNS